MRARNLKPSLFKNELLATTDPINAWVFIGLWCLADREGRLEDRPRRIHLEINPGRAYEGTEAALTWLAEQGFIVRYAHGSGQYIQVVSFKKHQNPHPREVASVIPAHSIDVQHGLGADSGAHNIVENHNQGTSQAQPRTDQGQSEAQASQALSPFPLPPSSFPIPLEDKTRVPRAADPDGESFALLKSVYPKRSGDQRWHEARQAVNSRIREGHSWAEILDGAHRYADWCKITGKIGTETVKQAATFVGPGKPFLEDWTPPLTKADTRLAGNLSAADEFMRRTEVL